ncbi:uncharacterized protein LOC114363631 [Ostrinia furnacalis]|uniref:uncharacterized protein LOC114363631 n=1 Tax=Ostrinia furnacalis TaxID=93504 RepID=UPI00103C8730|nr:uncharacterized protein LOC114363631 [Ostrinia furnacalis]
MSGKAYTMKEMKTIVEYLAERRAFAEIKGRKMWMDFANSKLTNRTWQSLKETFLKRILPDIHNPYYKLTVDQIRCFKEGYDVIAREKSNLEHLQLEDAWPTKAEKETDTETEKPGTSKDNNGEAAGGEDTQSAKIQSHDRASVDTVIIANCYETDDELRRVLESDLSPKPNKNQNRAANPPTKSMRDLITYSEPLTPMLQEVLNDFASEDDSDSELRMHIVEHEEPINNVIEIEDSDDIGDKDKNAANKSKTDKPTEDKIKEEPTAEDKSKKDTTPKDKANEDNPSIIQANKDIETDTNDANEVIEQEVSSESNIDKNKTAEKNIETDKSVGDSLDKDKTNEKSVQSESEIRKSDEFVQPKVSSLKLKKRKGVTGNPDNKTDKTDKDMYEIVEQDIPEKSNVDTLSNYAKNKDEIVSSTVSQKNTQNSSNSDTILPNNQEALNNPDKSATTVDHTQNDNSKSSNITEEAVKLKKNTRKRATSQDVAATSKTKKAKTNANGKQKAVSDTDDVVMKKLIKSKLAKTKLELKKKNVIDEVEDQIEKENEVNGNSKTDGNVIAKETASEEMPSTSKAVISLQDASELNLCLKSVSLYDEEFNKVSYIESETNEHETSPAEMAENKASTSAQNKDNAKKSATVNGGEKVVPKTTSEAKEDASKKKGSIARSIDEVVMLKSHSESDDEFIDPSPKIKVPVSRAEKKAQKDSALDNVFGLQSGGTKRKKRISYRRNSKHQRHHQESSDSSEWTSESDSESYVSPPRGRKNRQTRKYLKPRSARIHSLEDDGGLFVMYGKKIYPLVKDGNIIKNYLTYLPESDPEEEESYWKLKYVEERKRVAELKKLINEKKEEVVREKSPILPARPRNLSTLQVQSPLKNINSSKYFNSIDNNVQSAALQVYTFLITGPYYNDIGCHSVKLDVPSPVLYFMCIPDIEMARAPQKETKETPSDTGKILKIKFAKDNHEVLVEGHWSQIHPMLADVVQIFNKKSDAPSTTTRSTTPQRPATPQRPTTPQRPATPQRVATPQILSPRKPHATYRPASGKKTAMVRKTTSQAMETVSLSSEAPTPDEGIPRIETLEKVNKLETEIFKEIEKIDKEIDQEEDVEQPKEQSQNNVTTRKRASRTRKSSSTRASASLSPSSTRSPKRQKTSSDAPQETEAPPKKAKNKSSSKTELKETKQSDAKETVEAVDSTTSVTSKKESPKKTGTGKTPMSTDLQNQDKLFFATLIACILFPVAVLTEYNTRSNSRKSKAPSVETRASSSHDTSREPRYMFPATTRSRKSHNHSKSKDKNKRLANLPETFCLPIINDESTQGYQDSDISPPKANHRRKRKLSLSTVLYRSKNKMHRVKRKSYPCITEEGSSDTSSAFQIIVRPTSNSSLKSEAYKTDSYQLLFPQTKNVFRQLEKIDENTPAPNNSLHPNRHPALDGRQLEVRIKRLSDEFLTCYSNGNTDGNSSNVSLPMSPELSIVENLSVSKELVNSIENYPTINEMQANSTSDKVVHNKYLMSEIDVSMPLMQQECGLHESIERKRKQSGHDHTKMSLVSDSLLNKIDTVNIEDAPSLSESLDARLRNLLLESAKKMSISSIKEEDRNVETTGAKEVQKKEKSKKRCSTPRKKREPKKPKVPTVDPVVEEEITETCSYGGRKSCPPVIQIISDSATHKENTIVNTDKDKVVAENSKGRRKKDVIKVKILRPRNKSRSRSPEPTQNISKTTLHTDSGIHESGLTVQGLNDSIDLIHNHSETCLLANECMGDSVEFIETNTKSIISLNSDSATSSDKVSLKNRLVFQDCQDFVPDLFCENAQSFCRIDYVSDSAKHKDNASDTVYHSPVVSELSINSLITEDLSDETPQSSQPSKWYLLSEDETTNTNLSPAQSVGANLKQIFPVTCAVPDLSTITENSNDISRKRTTDSANSTKLDFNSPNVFDMNSC